MIETLSGVVGRFIIKSVRSSLSAWAVPSPLRQRGQKGQRHPVTGSIRVLTPRMSGLIAELQADRDPAHQREIYRRFDSEMLE